MRGHKTVIEFGTSKIACASAINRPKIGMEVLGYSSFPYSGIKNNKWADTKAVEDALYNALTELEKHTGIRVKNADVGIPACFMTLDFKTVEVPVKNKINNRVIDAVYDKAEPRNIGDDQIVINQFISWYMLDDGEIYVDVMGMESKRVTANVVSVIANKYFLEDIKTLLKNMGINLDCFICEPFAHALSLIPETKRDELSILADIGYYNTNISLVYGDSIIYMETLENGGGYITSDIAYALKIKTEIAEQLKRRYSFGLQQNNKISFMYAKDEMGKLKKYPYDILKEVIDSRTYDILSHIYKRMRQVEVKVQKHITTFITGGGINYMPGINSFVRYVFNNKSVEYCKINNTVLSSPSMQTMYALLDYSLNSDEDGAFSDQSAKNTFFGSNK